MVPFQPCSRIFLSFADLQVAGPGHDALPLLLDLLLRSFREALLGNGQLVLVIQQLADLLFVLHLDVIQQLQHQRGFGSVIDSYRAAAAKMLMDGPLDLRQDTKPLLAIFLAVIFTGKTRTITPAPGAFVLSQQICDLGSSGGRARVLILAGEGFPGHQALDYSLWHNNISLHAILHCGGVALFLVLLLRRMLQSIFQLRERLDSGAAVDHRRDPGEAAAAVGRGLRRTLYLL